MGDQFGHSPPMSEMSEVKFCLKKRGIRFTFLVRVYESSPNLAHPPSFLLPSFHFSRIITSSSDIFFHHWSSFFIIIDHHQSSSIIGIAFIMHTPFHCAHHLPLRTPSSTAHTIFHCAYHLPLQTPSSTAHSVFHCAHHLPLCTPSCTATMRTTTF